MIKQVQDLYKFGVKIEVLEKNNEVEKYLRRMKIRFKAMSAAIDGDNLNQQSNDFSEGEANSVSSVSP
jgi:hypothetical protein